MFQSWNSSNLYPFVHVPILNQNDEANYSNGNAKQQYNSMNGRWRHSLFRFFFIYLYLNIVYICVRLYKLLGDWPSGRTTLVRNHSFCFYMLAYLAHSVHRLASYHSVALIAFATPLQMHGNEQIRKTSKLRRWWRWLFGRKITFH